MTDADEHRPHTHPIPANTMTGGFAQPVLLPIFVVSFFFVAIMVLFALSNYSLRLNHQHQALINASVEIKNELTTFHLWFEELVQDDPHITEAKVWQHLNNAKHYAQHMLGEKHDHEYDFPPLEEPRLRTAIIQTLNSLEQLKRVGEQRLQQRQQAGSAQDETFDTVFAAALADAEQVAASLQANIDEQRRHYRQLSSTIGILLGIFALTFAFFLFISRRTLIQTSRALLASEQQYRAMFEASSDAILIVDNHCVVQAANPAAYTIYGYEPNTMRGLSLQTIVDCRVSDPCLMRLVEDPRSEQQLQETTAIHQDSHHFPIEIRMSPFQFQDQRAMLAIIRDITERKQAEQQLKAFNENLSELVVKRTAALESANRELESYSHSIAHDLRTPLRAITSFAQILKSDSGQRLNEEDQEHLARIINAGKHMARLIDDILQLNMVSRQELKVAELDITAMANNIIQELQQTQPRPTLECRIEENLHARGDKTAVYRLLHNLLGNAWKFTRDAASPRIHLFATRKEGRTVFVVEDNGVGFNMAYANKLFRPFQRLHHQDEFEGTGIGLATVARVIERHGGSVWAESQVGTGSCFYFSLQAPALPEPPA